MATLFCRVEFSRSHKYLCLQLVQFYSGSIIIPPMRRLQNDRSVGARRRKRFATYVKRGVAKMSRKECMGKATLTCDAMINNCLVTNLIEPST